MAWVQMIPATIMLKIKDQPRREWHNSLPLRITGIVNWALVFVGVVVAGVMMSGINDRLEKQYARSADGIAFQAYEYVHDHPRLDIDTLKTSLEEWRVLFDATAIEAKLDGARLLVGNKPEPPTVNQRRIRVTQPASGEAGYLQLSIYHPHLSTAASHQRKQTLMEIGVLFFVLMAVLTLVLRRVLSAPVIMLADTARDISLGQHDLRFDTRREDELGFVAKFINRALDGMQQQRKQLESALDQVRKSESALAQEKERIAVTLRSIGDGVITVDTGGCIDYLNPVAERLIGCSLNESLGRHVTEVIHLIDEDTLSAVEDPIMRCLHEGKMVNLTGNCALLRKHGQHLPISDSAAPIRDGEGVIVGAVMVFRDASEARRLTQQLSYEATHDALTGLMNRLEFERRLLQLLKNVAEDETKHVLCYVDLDRFKLVNDTGGHAAGDELLRRISRIIKQKMRDSDLLARLGGDEFGIVLRNCPLRNAQQIAESLCQAIKEMRFVWNGHEFVIGVSIGLVAINPPLHDLPELLNAADAACYEAKKSGRGRVQTYKFDET